MSASQYATPPRDESLAVELHNTLYANGGEIVDALATEASARRWLAALHDRLPRARADRALREDLIALREAVRPALHAITDGRKPSPADLATINRAAARAPQSPVAKWQRRGLPVAGTQFHDARPADVALAAIAADAIGVLATDRREKLRACEAPGCILLFVKDHPRREWCSDACGNRARQARHYARQQRKRRDREPASGGED
jgi:predicted RNA-binding Zn ribbon-like protein